MNYLIVGLGGMLGSMARFGITSLSLNLYPNVKFPIGTFSVNLVGCLLIGIIAGLLERISFFNPELRLLFITGILGGFTTFSAFGIETLYLIKSGDLILAVVYTTLSIILGVTLVSVGLRIGG